MLPGSTQPSNSVVPEHPATSITVDTNAPSNDNNNPTDAQMNPSNPVADQFVSTMNKWSPSYILMNKGATARDHLANERTFLAYMRTSLSLLTVGIAVIQLYRLTSPQGTPNSATEVVAAKVIGVLFVALGAAFVVFGCVRYFYAQALMVKGLFPASRGSVVFGGFFLVAITIFVFILTLVYL